MWKNKNLNLNKKKRHNKRRKKYCKNTLADVKFWLQNPVLPSNKKVELNEKRFQLNLETFIRHPRPPKKKKIAKNLLNSTISRYTAINRRFWWILFFFLLLFAGDQISIFHNESGLHKNGELFDFLKRKLNFRNLIDLNYLPRLSIWFPIKRFCQEEPWFSCEGGVPSPSLACLFIFCIFYANNIFIKIYERVRYMRITV